MQMRCISNVDVISYRSISIYATCLRRHDVA